MLYDYYHQYKDHHQQLLLYDLISIITFIIHFTAIIILFVFSCISDISEPSSDLNDPSITTSSLSVIEFKKYNNKQNNKKISLSSLMKPNYDDNDYNNQNQYKSFSQTNTLIDCPDQRASYLSLLCFSWYDSLTRIGYKKSLTLDDLWSLSEEHSTRQLAKRFDHNWYNNCNKTKTNQHKQNSLNQRQILSNEHNKNHNSNNNKILSEESGVFTTIIRTFYLPILLGAFYRLGNDLIKFASPQLLK